MIVLPDKVDRDPRAIEEIEKKFEELKEEGVLYLRARRDHITGLMGERGLTWDECWLDRCNAPDTGKIVRVFLLYPEKEYNRQGILR